MHTLQKSLLIAGGIVAGVALTGAMYAHRGTGWMTDDTSIQTAIEANDYSQLSSDAQTRISEEKFAKLMDRHTTREAVQSAIDDADYDAFVQVADDRMLKRINDQEDFDEMVARRQARAAHHDALETAVVANDFAAFDAAMESHKAEMQALHDDDDDHRKDRDKFELTSEQKQEKFQKLVDYYAENGELPDHKSRMGRGHGMRGNGDCDHHRRGDRGFDRD